MSTQTQSLEQEDSKSSMMKRAPYCEVKFDGHTQHIQTLSSNGRFHVFKKYTLHPPYVVTHRLVDTVHNRERKLKLDFSKLLINRPEYKINDCPLNLREFCFAPNNLLLATGHRPSARAGIGVILGELDVSTSTLNVIDFVEDVVEGYSVSGLVSNTRENGPIGVRLAEGGNGYYSFEYMPIDVSNGRLEFGEKVEIPENLIFVARQDDKLLGLTVMTAGEQSVLEISLIDGQTTEYKIKPSEYRVNYGTGLWIGDKLMVLESRRDSRTSGLYSLDFSVTDSLGWRDEEIEVEGIVWDLSIDCKNTLIALTQDAKKHDVYYIYRLAIGCPETLAQSAWTAIQRGAQIHPGLYEHVMSKLPPNSPFQCSWPMDEETS